jgi:hypothetical protein
MNTAVVTGSIKDFNEIKIKKYLKNATPYLWKPDISGLYLDNSFLADSFGDGIDKRLLVSASDEIHQSLKNWYKDSEGNDFSKIDGISLGLTFESSIEIIFYNITQTYLSYKHLLSRYDKIIIHESNDPVKTLVANWMNTHESQKFEIVNLEIKHRSRKKFGHPMSLFRDLNFSFQGSGLNSLISFLLLRIQLKHKKSVYIMDAGKFEGYFSYRRKSKGSNFKLLVPIRRNLNNIIGNLLFWQRTRVKSTNFQVNDIISKIDQFSWSQETNIVPKSLYKSSIEAFVYPYWPAAMSYYNHYVKIFKYFKPKLAVYGSDGVESFILSAYAAKKLNITTAMMNHGLAGWFFSNMLKNESCVFDYYLSAGNYDTKKYLKNNCNPIKIKNISLPWFSHSKFTARSKNCKSKLNAFLIPYDPGYSLQITPSYLIRYLKEMIEVCEEMGINIAGIKLRDSDAVKAYGLKEGKNHIFGKKMSIYSSYGNLSNFFDEMDIAIGPINSSTIECHLANIPYYSYYDLSMYSSNPNLSFDNLKDIIYIASNKEELKNHLKNKLIFKKNMNVNSILNSEKSFDGACCKLDDVFTEILKK